MEHTQIPIVEQHTELYPIKPDNSGVSRIWELQKAVFCRLDRKLGIKEARCRPCLRKYLIWHFHSSSWWQEAEIHSVLLPF